MNVFGTFYDMDLYFLKLVSKMFRELLVVQTISSPSFILRSFGDVGCYFVLSWNPLKE